MSLVDIPSHWIYKKLKYVASLKSGEGITSNDISEKDEYPVFGGNGIRGFTSNYTHHGTYPLIGRQGALCGNINYASGKFWASEHAVVVNVNRGHHVRWLGEVLRSMNLNQYSLSAAQPGISVEVIENLSIPVPPEPEQELIANFLDRETARIDTLVAEKERMLALLEDKRVAMITQAVTRGLDHDVPMKPSGLDWLGEIPAHWQVCQLKRTLTSSDYGISESIREDGNVTVLRMSCIVDGRIDVSKAGNVEDVDPSLLLCRNDLLFNRTNSLDQIAKVGLVDFDPDTPLSFASYLVRLRVNQRALPNYMAYLLNSSAFLAFARKEAIPAIGQANLNPTKYGEIMIPLPSTPEQERICEYLDHVSGTLSPLHKEIDASIELLKERRAALITAAVTGQISVEEMSA